MDMEQLLNKCGLNSLSTNQHRSMCRIGKGGVLGYRNCTILVGAWLHVPVTRN